MRRYLGARRATRLRSQRSTVTFLQNQERGVEGYGEAFSVVSPRLRCFVAGGGSSTAQDDLGRIFLSTIFKGPSRAFGAADLMKHLCPCRPSSLSKEKIPQLKERLREKGLPLSGKKVELVERLVKALRSEASVLPPPATRRSFPQGHSELIYEPSTHNGFASSTVGGRSLNPVVDEELVKGRNRWYVQNALVDMISAFFVNDDGTRKEVVSSRNVGRALSELPAPDGSEQSALLCLKSRWVSLKAFLKSCPSQFELTEGEPSGDSIQFGVMMAPASNGTGEASDVDGDRRYSGARPSASAIALRDSRGGG